VLRRGEPRFWMLSQTPVFLIFHGLCLHQMSAIESKNSLSSA
jgi:hypothetical protein